MGDRKYGHRGYQDSDRERGERRPPAPRAPDSRPRVEGAPRGRGVGLPPNVVFKCAVCGQEARSLSRVEPTSACPSCGKPLHTCTNCSFLDPEARFECKKPIAARLEDKAQANECLLYQAKTVRDLRSSTRSTPDDARSAFDALFKKK